MPSVWCLQPSSGKSVEACVRGSAEGLPLGDKTRVFAGDPGRKVQDKYPAFAAIGVNPERNEVIVTDENLFQLGVRPSGEHA